MNEQSSKLTTDKLQWFRQQLTSWAADHLRDFPWRKTTDPYAILVAEVLLQKTGAETVAPIYASFLARYPTLAILAGASVEDVAMLLRPLGLAFRAERLCAAAGILMEKHRGIIPRSEEELLLLPGVGKYTARSICAHAFGQPAAVLDANVARILERFFGLQGERVKSRCKILWAAAEAIASARATSPIVPENEVSRWNLTLLDFGAMVCTAKKPHCVDCPLHEQCCYLSTN
jgi:A/G-specific adenine glycosylase